jgi:circadian clock protein KaiC
LPTLHFSADLLSFLSDDVIFQRYVEMQRQVRKVMTVIKMRGSDHRKDLRLYDVTADGVEMGERAEPSHPHSPRID